MARSVLRADSNCAQELNSSPMATMLNCNGFSNFLAFIAHEPREIGRRCRLKIFTQPPAHAAAEP